MSNSPKLVKPCHWILHRRVLGEGGNGKVYQAHHPDRPDVPVAIKVLEKEGKEAHKRFQYEIEAHGIIGNHLGVLPILDSEIPAYGSEESAWLVMPVATPIRKALGLSPDLEKVISAIVDIASTLADLKDKYGMSHRDIKPENLFSCEGRYVLGDLGLVSFPGKEVLTLPGDRIGAANFQAPETLNNSDTAQGEPADVHALAKTLWVLAMPWVNGKPVRWPQPGPQRRDYLVMRLGTYVSHPRIVPLELVLERTTHPDPTERPDLAEMRDELNEWLVQPQPSANTPDLSHLQAAFNTMVDLDSRHRSQAAERNASIETIRNRIKDRVATLALSLQDIRDGYISQQEYHLLNSHFESNDTGYPHGRPQSGAGSSMLSIDSLLIGGRASIRLRSIFAMAALDNDENYIAAAHFVEDPFEKGEAITAVWQSSAIVRRGSAAEENTIERLAKSLEDHLPKALQTFNGRIALRLGT